MKTKKTAVILNTLSEWKLISWYAERMLIKRWIRYEKELKKKKKKKKRPTTIKRFYM